MTMITCLILWIPGGTTYVPVGPPATRGGPAGGSPRGASAAYATAVENTATMLATRTRMRLALIVILPEMPETRSPVPSGHIGITVDRAGKLPESMPERSLTSRHGPEPASARGG